MVTSDWSEDHLTLVVAMKCPHQRTECAFTYGSATTADSAYEASVQSVAMAHEDVHHCGCASAYLPPRAN